MRRPRDSRRESESKASLIEDGTATSHGVPDDGRARSREENRMDIE